MRLKLYFLTIIMIQFILYLLNMVLPLTYLLVNLYLKSIMMNLKLLTVKINQGSKFLILFILLLLIVFSRLGGQPFASSSCRFKHQVVILYLFVIYMFLYIKLQCNAIGYHTNYIV